MDIKPELCLFSEADCASVTIACVWWRGSRSMFQEAGEEEPQRLYFYLFVLFGLGMS